jgi:hypothetical protein
MSRGKGRPGKLARELAALIEQHMALPLDEQKQRLDKVDKKLKELAEKNHPKSDADAVQNVRQMPQHHRLQPPEDPKRQHDWLHPPKNRCPSMHGMQQCQWEAGHSGPHQECMEVWNHE